jgi:cytochrome c oxidase subunit 1
MANSAESVTTVQETGSIGVREIVTATGAGFVGTVAMSPLLAVAWVLGVLSPTAFESLAALTGLGASLPLGLLIFLGGGTTTLPLLFVALAMFLPGRTTTEKGMVFAAIVWTGWSFAFYTGQAGPTLVGFLVVGLLSHVVYGGVLGALYGRFASFPEYAV